MDYERFHRDLMRAHDEEPHNINRQARLFLYYKLVSPVLTVLLTVLVTVLLLSSVTFCAMMGN